jgi:hypothetical protein
LKQAQLFQKPAFTKVFMTTTDFLMRSVSLEEGYSQDALSVHRQIFSNSPNAAPSLFLHVVYRVYELPVIEDESAATGA